MNTSIAIFKDPEASKAWGWIQVWRGRKVCDLVNPNKLLTLHPQEMYGFCLGVWIAGIKKVDLFLHMMSQPPWDRNMDLSPGKPFHIIHYTYGELF